MARRRSKARSLARLGLRPWHEATVFVATCAVLLFFGGAYVASSGAVGSNGASAEQAEQPLPTPTIDDYRLASILFVPWTGRETCEERHFDNLTGRIEEGAVVPCTFATAADGSRKRVETTDLSIDERKINRMRAILGSFKK